VLKTALNIQIKAFVSETHTRITLEMHVFVYGHMNEMTM